MKLSIFSKRNKNSKKEPTVTVTFSRLPKTEQEKVLKKGAEHFSKKFTKVIVKLANE
jgi:hypothetical protein